MSKAGSLDTLLSSQNNFKRLIHFPPHNLHSSANFIQCRFQLIRAYLTLPCSTNLSPFIGTLVFKAFEAERYIKKEKWVSRQAVSQTR